MNRDVIGTLFEMASQFKFRYPFKGMITTEDLWDLSKSELDTVYKTLNKELNAVQEEGLLQTKSVDEGVKANDLKNKMLIVKYIFTSKQQAEELDRIAAENAMKRKRIMEVLAKKQNDALENMTEEELQAALAELG
jgi:hypothetical protein